MPPTYLSTTNYQSAFEQLNQLLIDFGFLWRSIPFFNDILNWKKQYPDLHQALRQLSDEQLHCFEDESCLLDWMADYLPTLGEVSHWAITPFKGEQIDMPKFADIGVPGRKKQQIIGFTSALKHFAEQGSHKGRILDWCSGKGHLAKQLHHVMEQTVTCLEYDKTLCDAGAVEVEKLGYKIHFIEQNVLQPISQEVINAARLNTALHACGDLHTTMMKTATQACSGHIALSPCCYHLTKSHDYEKLSERAKQSSLQLSKADLRLAVLQTVTAGTRVRRLREQEQIWRIAFDLLQRSINGNEEYCHTPSISKQLLSGSFTDYCIFMADQLSLQLPSNVDGVDLLQRATEKFKQVTRLEKARLAFRKAMEYWLLLDRVMYLEEQGYEVELKTFCQEQVTPRNALILARRLA